jgi:thymidylate synthase
MITSYKNRKGTIIEISEMESDHLINSYDYFRKKRYEWQQKNEDGTKILKISLLIAQLKSEIDKRRLFEF